MLSETDNFYLQKPEPLRSCLLMLRNFILAFDKDITESWKYKMPIFCYNGKMFCYLWIDKKTHQPYLGIVEGKSVTHPKLIQGSRSRMKILMLDAGKDVPIKTIHAILNEAMSLYKRKY